MGRGDAEDSSEEYRRILQSLRGTAEGLLINQVSNVWNIYGGLNRLHHVMEKIFKHGCRVFDQEGDPDCWVFIQGLSWLQPSLFASPSVLAEEENSQNLPPNVSGKALVWLYKSLECHTLSQKLFWLLSDRNHLLSCFEKTAYLCQEKYGKATLICLKAVEQNQPSLLTEIDPYLYLASWNFKVFHKTHRKCSSFPEAELNSRYSGRRRYLLKKQKSADGQLSEIMSRSSQKKSPLGAGCFGSDIRDADKEEEDDGGSFCEEATEGTFAGDADSATTNEELNNNRENNESAENDTENKPSSVQQSVKHWYSLPSLCCYVNSDSASGFNFLSQDNRSSVKRIVRSCPSSPTSGVPSHSSSLIFHSPPRSPLETSTSVSVQSPCSKLSPSVLEVDYNATELHSDHELTLSQKCNRNWKNGSIKIGGSNANFKQQLFMSDNSATKMRPQSVRSTAVLNTIVTSSGSSDTINIESSRLTKSFSQPNASIGNPAWLQCQPKTRPSDLDIPSRMCEANNADVKQASSQMKNSCRKSRRPHLGVVGSAPEYAHEWPGLVDVGRRRIQKKSFIEDGGSSVLPMATGFFPRPMQGQSLASFLSSGQFARPSAELDRENAHFSICEAIIATIELVKCNQELAVAVIGPPTLNRDQCSGGTSSGGGRASSGLGDESDEEGNPMKQRIRLRRRQRQHQQQQLHPRRQMQAWSGALLSDGRTDNTKIVPVMVC